MKCPECKREVARGVSHCPYCGQEMPETDGMSFLLRLVIMLFSWIAVLAIVALGIYKLYFWIDDYKLQRLYTRGALTPAVTQITMSDGRAGHAITYYGDDGDQIFFETLNRSVEFSGGVARLELPDSDWFGSDIEEVESADVSVVSTLIYEKGDKRRLPTVKFEVEAPTSPIVVKSPDREDLSINNSIYTLQVQVVPGSRVNVNGKDVTDIVDHAGLLSVNVNVFPIGDNVYSVIVDTPNHKQGRKNVVIYRQKMEIAVELNNNVPTSSATSNVTISGKCDLGATISVDSPYMEGSLVQNQETGEFNFIAQLTVIGDNTVLFRASQEGKADSVISLNIDYLPSVDEYGSLAWAMDYKALCAMFEQWKGRVFKCPGYVIDVFEDGGVQYLIMNVGTEAQQLIVLKNYSKVDNPFPGGHYSAYADVDGRYMYQGHYYPMLNARYMYDLN